MRAGLGLSALLLAIGVCRAQFVNDNCHRTIDLSSPSLVREKRAIAILKDDAASKDTAEYVISVELPENATLAFVSAKEKDSNAELSLKQQKKAENDGRLYFGVKLSDPNARSVLLVELVFLHAQRPFPPVVPQGQRQLLAFSQNAYLPSPYPTKKQKTKVMYASFTRFNFNF